MDRRLHEVVLKGDVPAFLKLVEEEQDQNFITRQTVPAPSLNTALHMAARLGHLGLVAEILRLWPEMVAAENGERETPLHEACREGQLEMARLLLEVDPWVVYRVNGGEESALMVACKMGRLEVVKHLLGFEWVLMLEVDAPNSSLHVAAAAGHTEIVKEILKLRPDFAWKKNLHGYSPLHLACGKGHLEITREFLKLDPELCFIRDNDDRTALHWAAARGRVSVVDEILSTSLEPAEMLTKNGESVLHLAVKNNQLDAVRYIMEKINISNLINLPDSDGNTILHLAIAAKLTTMVIYLLKLGVDVNVINRKGRTALDVVETDSSNSGALAIIPALQEAGAQRCDQLPPAATSFHIQHIVESIPAPNPRHHDRRHHHHHHHHRRRQKSKQTELQNEGLRNARNTITVVAVLIATVTFAAGINPPGGFDQKTGKAILGRKPQFKAFLTCNIVALFLSLGIVNVLVSIIPFKRRTLTKLLMVTHKVMWISTIFMAAAYISAILAIMPLGRDTWWVAVELVAIGGGLTVMVILGLAIMLGRHWLKKMEWRKKKNKDGSPHSSISRVEDLQSNHKKSTIETSSNSDVESSDYGFHVY